MNSFASEMTISQLTAKLREIKMNQHKSDFASSTDT